MPSFAKDERPDHPTPKPLDAFGIPMRQHVARGGLCYEPFSGSGSQIMAGEANGRRVFAMEISPAYVDVAVERWQAETGRDAILDGDGRTFAEVKPSGWARPRPRPRGPTRPDDVDGVALPSSGLPAGAGDACLFGLSLCSGAGGLDLGLHLACPGYRTVGHVERDAYAAAILVARMEDAALDRAPVWDDVATFDGRPWRGAVDIVTAGYPCQPFSVAGKRRGADDPRHLWPHVARIVGEVEPPFVFLENVAHHLRLGFPEVAGGLVGMGYRLAAGLFTAAEVGAPHKRERLFILAHREATTWPTPRACSGTRSSGGNRTEMMRLWPTPLAGDSKGTRKPDEQPHRDGAPAQRRHDALRCNPALDDAHGAGSQGRGDEPREHAGERAAWPPGPGDADGWRTFLRHAPDLEPSLRRGADGLAHRVDRLRLCGNGVVPLVAAHALRTLAAQLLADG
jgi:DNA (cytosine-5)-methyltransferase 1